MLPSERLKIIFSVLPECRKFADVGCDHGYIAKEMLVSGKAEIVVASDISAPSLNKARLLLGEFGKSAECVLSDGLKQITTDTDLVLIAGMGGEEIISILLSSPFLPEKLVVQPMKNADKLRKTLLSLGYAFKKDFMFKDVKFYDLIYAEKGLDDLTENEILFGRDNLNGNNKAFKEYLGKEIEKYEAILSGDLTPSVREEILSKKQKLTEVYVK